MCKSTLIPVLGLTLLLTTASRTLGQSAPYIGFVYPAGGQQGITTEIRVGGQRLDGLRSAVVSGQGVTAEIKRFYRKLSNQEVTLLREQLRELRREVAEKKKAKQKVDGKTQQFIARLEKRIGEWVNRPASDALSSIAVLEVTVAPDAKPGAREIRLIGARGITNPMAFYVGQLPEHSRPPMVTSVFQVLGKEALAQRKRPPEEEEVDIELPCIVNGQIASGEVNRYRFQASRGQRLVVSAKARELIPYIADAVPGWFQPVLALQDADGNELAFNDDYRFKPDPTLYFEVPADGEYLLTITDALYRGREDFIYRVTIGELPFVTHIFPLGVPAGESLQVDMRGWNLGNAQLTPPANTNRPGVYPVAAKKNGFVTNTLPLAIDTLPECFDGEPNNQISKAQAVQLPIIVNGRINRPDDRDVFEVSGNAGDTIVAEVHARRLDSPLDSMLKVTDSSGRPLAQNDDHMDPAVGLNTHHADSYISMTLPKDGKYFVHVSDTARDGGDAFAYRLRIGPPRPDFALRVVPSSINLRGKSGGAATVYAIRRDGFDGPIRLTVEDLPKGLLSGPVTLKENQVSTRVFVRTKLNATDRPVNIKVVGRATIQDQEVVRPAVPAEDRMQAFLWRHLVPAENLKALVVSRTFQPPPKRTRPPKLELAEVPTEPVKFTQKQVAGRLRQLDLLFDEWLLTDDFYSRKVAQCEVYEAQKPSATQKK